MWCVTVREREILNERNIGFCGEISFPQREQRNDYSFLQDLDVRSSTDDFAETSFQRKIESFYSLFTVTADELSIYFSPQYLPGHRTGGRGSE